MGIFLYAGIIDPGGGVNMLWPLFGMANQILAAIALSIATCIIIKSDKIKYFWVTTIPLCWLTVITLTASFQRIFSDDIRVGTIAAAKNIKYQLTNNLLPTNQIKIAPQLIFNQYVVAALTAFFAVVLIIILMDVINITIKILRKKERKITHPPHNIADHNKPARTPWRLINLNLLMEKISGNYEYKKYLSHHRKHHHSQKVMTKKEFFEKKEKDKWKEINTCC